MKHATVILLLVLVGCQCKAQTFEEWFRQKETQKKYLLQQIAAFHVYLGYVQKGYSIAQKGLTAIGRIKNGDFNLHKDFFASLNNVNPNISSYAKVAHIIALQVKLVQVYKDTYKQVRKSDHFDRDERGYISRVFTNLLDDCSATIMELTAVITAEALEMKDNERLQRIDLLYYRMREHYAFAQHFGGEVRLLTIQRMKEKNAVQTDRALNGIKTK